ncbi:MAG: hypothetical protein LM573_07080 [Thermofilum sp.]|nr:hypothetical protein [Thermofilum sp.]
MSRSKASIIALLFFFAFLPALSFSQPAVVHQVACFSTTKAILYNGTVLELPSLRPLAQLGPIEGCDIYEGYGEHIAVWRNGRVEVYDGLSRRFAVQGDRALIGMRFVLVTAKDFVAVYSLYGFQVFRLDNYTTPAYVRLLGYGKADSKAVLLITPTTCPTGMRIRSYILVYDLDLGLWDIYETGIVSFIAVPSGALWIKNATLYHNGQAIGNAPEKVYVVNGFDGYAYTQHDKAIIVAINGSTYTLPLPGGRDLAVSRLSEGFAACSSYECTCTFNCTGFSQIAYQAFTPPTVTETSTHYLLYVSPNLYLLEKPKPTAPQNSTQPNSQTPINATTPQNTAQPPINSTTTQGNTTTTQPPVNTTLPQNGTKPQDNAPANNTSTNNTPSIQNNAQSTSPRQDTGQSHEPSMSLVISIALLIVLAFAGYTFYRRKYRFIS